MKIFCIEQNYFGQKREQLNDIPREPAIFVKPQSALLQTENPFSYQKTAKELYCGCELVLRISEKGNDIEEKSAGKYYDSISIGINFTAFENQDQLMEDSWSWEKAKAWDKSSVAGLLLPADIFKDKKDINFCLYKNRQLLQLGNSGLMINNFDRIISAISKSCILNVGDLLFTGTPAGTGKLEAGDKLEAFLEDDSLLEFDIE